MGDGFVQVAPDSTGKKTQTFENTVGADSVHAQAVVAVNVSGVVPGAMMWVSAKNIAPTANSVQADTGSLAAGNYDFEIGLTCSDTVAVGKGLVLEHRNAANSATLQNLGAVAATGSVRIRLENYTLGLNERLRVIAGTAAGAANSMYVSCIGRRPS